jgi:hypothetical protein
MTEAMSGAESGTSSGHALPRLVVMFWLVVLVAQTIAAALWWWLQPGGFSWSHPRFWLNRVLPLVVLAWSLGSLGRLHREDRSRLVLVLSAWPCLWGAAALSSKMCFPITMVSLWLLPLSFAVVMSLALIPIGRHAAPRGMLILSGIICLWLLTGAAIPYLERPEPPATRPLLTTSPSTSASEAPRNEVIAGAIHLGRDVMVQTSDGSLNVRIAPLTVIVSPLLRFLSRSPDGCWTVFARPEDRAGPEPRLNGEGGIDVGRWLAYSFQGQGPARLTAARDVQRNSVDIDAMTQLERPIDSHLNSYCDLEVRGHRRLSLGFSPCPEARIDVVHYDYPFGRPARFAFVDGERRFRVVEASSGEKGPFRTLAEGRLERDERLAITLHDGDRSVARVTLFDWSAQVSTQLSPTAGWNVPVNAIEFSLSDENPSSPASIFITLAATSVGRGWDSVGHSAGTYRNRITIEPSP